MDMALHPKSFQTFSQGQNQIFQNQNHSQQQQAQSKDMTPRFIKKGSLNADEVQHLVDTHSFKPPFAQATSQNTLMQEMRTMHNTLYSPS